MLQGLCWQDNSLRACSWGLRPPGQGLFHHCSCCQLGHACCFVFTFKNLIRSVSCWSFASQTTCLCPLCHAAVPVVVSTAFVVTSACKQRLVHYLAASMFRFYYLAYEADAVRLASRPVKTYMQVLYCTCRVAVLVNHQPLGRSRMSLISLQPHTVSESCQSTGVKCYRVCQQPSSFQIVCLCCRRIVRLE